MRDVDKASAFLSNLGGQGGYMSDDRRADIVDAASTQYLESMERLVAEANARMERLAALIESLRMPLPDDVIRATLGEWGITTMLDYAAMSPTEFEQAVPDPATRRKIMRTVVHLNGILPGMLHGKEEAHRAVLGRPQNIFVERPQAAARLYDETWSTIRDRLPETLRDSCAHTFGKNAPFVDQFVQRRISLEKRRDNKHLLEQITLVLNDLGLWMPLIHTEEERRWLEYHELTYTDLYYAGHKGLRGRFMHALNLA